MKVLGVKILEKCKDGGPDSPVDAYVLFECKKLCSVMLLKFNKGCRDNFHSHAFNALTWFIKGSLVEERLLDGRVVKYKYERSLLPKVTMKDNLHRVVSHKVGWCFTVRGKWQDTWTEFNSKESTTTELTNGRVVLSTTKS